MMGVAALRHDPDVEAAMLSHYGLRARDVTLRELRVLTERLPPGAWSDPDRGEVWSSEAHLLAGLIDAVNQLTYATVIVNVDADRRAQVPEPKPIPRPRGGHDEVRKVDPVNQVQQMASLLGWSP